MCRALSRMVTPPMPKMPAMNTPPPAPPPVPVAPPLPTQVQAAGPVEAAAALPPSQSPAALEAGETTRQQAQRQRGRAATILTGSQGLMGTEMIARPAATRVLLGG